MINNAFLSLLIAAVLTWPVVSANAIDTETPREIDIVGPPVTDAAAVVKAQSMLTEKVMACAENEKTPPLCQCRFQDELGALRSANDMALKNHPEWKDAMVSYRDQEGKPRTPVSFRAVRETLEQCK